MVSETNTLGESPAEPVCWTNTERLAVCGSLLKCVYKSHKTSLISWHQPVHKPFKSFDPKAHINSRTMEFFQQACYSLSNSFFRMDQLCRMKSLTQRNAQNTSAKSFGSLRQTVSRVCFAAESFCHADDVTAPHSNLSAKRTGTHRSLRTRFWKNGKAAFWRDRPCQKHKGLHTQRDQRLERLLVNVSCAEKEKFKAKFTKKQQSVSGTACGTACRSSTVWKGKEEPKSNS